MAARPSRSRPANAPRQATGAGPGLWSRQRCTTDAPAPAGAQVTTRASTPAAPARSATGIESASRPGATRAQGRSGASPNPGADGSASAAR